MLFDLFYRTYAGAAHDGDADLNVPLIRFAPPARPTDTRHAKPANSRVRKLRRKRGTAP